MKKCVILLMALGTLACAPENDPTAKYETEEFVPLQEKKFKEQYYLAGDAIRLYIENRGQSTTWQKTKDNELIVHLVTNLQGLVDPKIEIKVGQYKELPAWLNFKVKESRPGKITYVLIGNPSQRKDFESAITNYEVEFRVVYDDKKSNQFAVKALMYYKSQTSQRVNIEIGST